MRTLMTIRMSVGPANQAIRDGSLPRILKQTMEELRPEAAYFCAQGGKRTGMMVFDLQDPSQIPAIAERFFMGFEAEVDFCPVMNAADLAKGLAQLESLAVMA